MTGDDRWLEELAELGVALKAKELEAAGLRDKIGLVLGEIEAIKEDLRRKAGHLPPVTRMAPPPAPDVPVSGKKPRRGSLGEKIVSYLRSRKLPPDQGLTTDEIAKGIGADSITVVGITLGRMVKYETLCRTKRGYYALNGA